MQNTIPTWYFFLSPSQVRRKLHGEFSLQGGFSTSQSPHNSCPRVYCRSSEPDISAQRPIPLQSISLVLGFLDPRQNCSTTDVSQRRQEHNDFNLLNSTLFPGQSRWRTEITKETPGGSVKKASWKQLCLWESVPATTGVLTSTCVFSACPIRIKTFSM